VFARVVQFAKSLGGGPSKRDLAWARAALSEGEWQVFEGLNPKEQAHAIRVARKAQGFAAMSSLPTNEQSALIKAALLHDVGKCGAIGPMDKVAIVLISRCCPALAEKLSDMGAQSSDPTGQKFWRWAPVYELARAFHFHRIHAERGAKMVTLAGADRRVAELIRDHHAPAREDRLLELLSRADRTS